MDDTVGTECGVFAAIDFKEASIFPYIYWGMRAQNHRGHQSYGFLTFNSGYKLHRGLDLIPKIKAKDIQNWMARLPGHVGIGNVRYTTSGKLNEEALIKGTQPVTIETKKVKVKIPAEHTGKVYGIINPYKEKEEWLSNGDLECIVAVPAGAIMEFYDKLNSVTHGSAFTEEIKEESA